jgi:predicted dithiol-disulfide oxidoreductase (DUF899 family)
MTTSDTDALKDHPVVSHEEWLAARRALLEKEKALLARARLSRLQRDLPWEAVAKAYKFDGLTAWRRCRTSRGRSQLIVYHFMFAPDWSAGCPHCSHWADNFNSVIVHLNHRDVSMIAVSRAPYATLAAYRKRMGWTFNWVSSFETDFNFDYHVSFTRENIAAGRAMYNFKRQDPGVAEREGVSVFFKDDAGKVFHTYSAYARGIDLFSTDYNYLDLVPRTRRRRTRPLLGSPPRR